MELEKAKAIADDVVEKLKPFCSKIEIAGSIRRRRPNVHDIDIVLIPERQGNLIYALQQLGRVKMGGPKIIRVGMGFSKGIDLDIYVATPEIWATLLLIRTGSASHNIRMCSRARNMNMVLHANGTGLFRLEAQGCEGVEVLMANESEEQIFAALGLPYEEPERRQ
jgi:DNA polymerase/3'-5' exonuclease PolX